MGYTHAGGIDRPLGAVRGTTPFYPHTNARGLYEAATIDNGAVLTNDVAWPGKSASAYLGWTPRTTPYEWFGSLVTEQADASGLLYRRNRYYDPKVGRFTQPDPIGIAGGLNSYGFASGDPVNYSDPFGLSPDTDGDCPPGYVAVGATCYNQVAIMAMVVTSGGSRFASAARSAAAGVANTWRAWRISRAGDNIMAAAQSGGKHAGFLRNYAGRSAGEIGRATRSLEGHVARHEKFLRDPASHVKDWNGLSAQHQERLLTRWRGEIQAAREQIEILGRIP